MNKIKKVIKEFNYLKARDFWQIFVFLFSIPISLIYRLVKGRKKRDMAGL